MAEHKDMVNHPAHYGGKIETIEIIETVIGTIDNPVYAFLTGQVFKYMCRWNRKGKPLEDLKKASWYLNRLIDKMEAE